MRRSEFCEKHDLSKLDQPIQDFAPLLAEALSTHPLPGGEMHENLARSGINPGGRIDPQPLQGDEMHMVKAQPAFSDAVARHARSGSVARWDFSAGLMKVRADTSALYLKIRRSQRYISGPHFLQYRALLQAHAEELAAAGHALDGQLRHLRGNGACSIELGINVHTSNDD